MKNKVVFIFGIVLLIALIATYWNHFDNGFHFDDSHTIVNNVHLYIIYVRYSLTVIYVF